MTFLFGGVMLLLGMVYDWELHASDRGIMWFCLASFCMFLTWFVTVRGWLDSCLVMKCFFEHYVSGVEALCLYWELHVSV